MTAMDEPALRALPARELAPASAKPSADASLARIRHDLRTPVNHIIGFSEILIEDAQGLLPEVMLEDLRKMRAGGEQLLSLINQHVTENALASATPDLHGLCHELRTPVNQITGYAELLKEQCLELRRPEFEPDLERILSAARRWLVLMEGALLHKQPSSAGHAVDARPSRPTEHFSRHHPLAKAPEPSTQALSRDEGRLLLADDDEPNRELLRRRLEKLGYEVEVCRNGLEALQRVRAGRFDLVLLDQIMPGLDGAAVLASLKADPHLRHLPVIMISAFDQPESIVRCIELGAEDYVAKPFDPVFLRARIGAALEKKRLRDREVSYLQQIEEQKQRSDELLHIILPEDVANELKTSNTVQPRRFENVGVLFCDLVGFTTYCDQQAPEQIVQELQRVIESFEELAARHQLEKIKTIGDAFMATAGVPTALPNPALACISCGLDMIAAARGLPPRWQVRVGIHVGPVIAGVVGRRKYQYDVWGDTVNLAARMAETAQPGSICFSSAMRRFLGGSVVAEAMGRFEIKGKGPLDLYLVRPPAP